MAGVPTTMNGVLIDYYGRTIMGPIKFVGEMMRSDVGIGGGPIIPPPDGGNGDKPPGNGAHPEHPIVIPLPPSPIVPAPGSPPVIVGGTQPVHPVVPPDAVLMQYPGIGKVVVPKPTQTVTFPPGSPEAS